jgi:hypothetical protein
MEAQTNRTRKPPVTRDHLRGAAAGALAAAVCLIAVLIYPPVRGVFYKGFGRIEEPIAFDYIFQDDGSVTLTKYTGGEATITVPASVEGRPVVTLHSLVFVELTYSSRIVIEEGITRIDPMAVLFCPNVSEIVIPASVTEIRPNAFSSCAEDLILYGQPGSAAEEYARANKLRFAAR